MTPVYEGYPVFVRQAHHDMEVAGIAMPGSNGNVANVHLFSSGDPYQILTGVKQREYADDLGFRIPGDRVSTENRPVPEPTPEDETPTIFGLGEDPKDEPKASEDPPPASETKPAGEPVSEDAGDDGSKEPAGTDH